MVSWLCKVANAVYYWDNGILKGILDHVLSEMELGREIVPFHDGVLIYMRAIWSVCVDKNEISLTLSLNNEDRFLYSISLDEISMEANIAVHSTLAIVHCTFLPVCALETCFVGQSNNQYLRLYRTIWTRIIAQTIATAIEIADSNATTSASYR